MSSNPIYCFFATPASWAPFFLRMALTSIFFFHGTQKAFGFFGGPGWTKAIEEWTAGGSVPYVIVATAIVAEIIVSFALFFGLLTRLAALFVVIIIGGSLLFGHEVTGFQSVEFPIVIIATGFALMAMGGGRFSLDRGLSKNLLPY